MLIQKMGKSYIKKQNMEPGFLEVGEQVEYQGRKKRRTTNALYLTDSQRLPLSMSEPVVGNNNDIFDIEVQFAIVTETLEEAQIPGEGLFLNADAGFDTKEFPSSVKY